MRKFLFAIVLLLAVYFLLTRFTEVEQIALTLQRGDKKWILLAMGLHFVWVVNLAASFRACYRLLGIEETIERLMLLSLSAFFINVIAPAAGVSGMAAFLSDGQARGKPTGRVASAVALGLLYDYLAFIGVLALGLTVLIRRGRLMAAELIASVIMVVIAAAFAFLLWLGMRSGDQLGNALAWMARRVNRILRPFRKRDYLSQEAARVFAGEVAEGLGIARQAPRGAVLLPAALAMSKQALSISILFMIFMAFGQPFTVGTLVAGYAIGYLFVIVSPVPSGIGFVEGAMTLALTTLRVPLAAASIITLAYRGVTLWLTLLYGMIAVRWVGREPPAPSPSES
jgi:glycosyltransferase 2 family protein